MQSFYDKNVTEKRFVLSSLAGKLDALSPLAVLGRGYSIASKNNVIIKSCKDVEINDSVKIRLKDGEINCTVNEVNYE